MRRNKYCWDLSDGVNIKIYTCHGMRGNQEFVYREVGKWLEVNDPKTIDYFNPSEYASKTA